MRNQNKVVNLVLSGGGIKGVAFAGVFEIAEKKGYRWGNIAGVSAGALVGALAGAGYTSKELKKILEEFDFAKIEVNEIANRVPIVSRYTAYSMNQRFYPRRSVESFFNMRFPEETTKSIGINVEFEGRWSNVLKNIVTFSKEGCLLDGDFLEEWVFDLLYDKGIRTFADLKCGIVDRVNPGGYKVRMTAVDANRGKVIVLPDDIAFYGIDPDKLEVAKAIRMSTSVPFAFKPVELKKKEGKVEKIYNIVDGGVFDNFPFWLIDDMDDIPTVGFKLDGEGKSKLLSINTPLYILKGLISAVHDIGIPKDTYKFSNAAAINTSNISFLDFNLTDKEKDYLYNAGKTPAQFLFNKIERIITVRKRGRMNLFGSMRCLRKY